MVRGEAVVDARRAARQLAAPRTARPAGFAALGHACPSPGPVARLSTLVGACVAARRSARLRAHFARLLPCVLPREAWLYVWHRFPYWLWPYVSSSPAANRPFRADGDETGAVRGIPHRHIGAIAAAGFLGFDPWRKAGEETATRFSAADAPADGNVRWTSTHLPSARCCSCRRRAPSAGRPPASATVAVRWLTDPLERPLRAAPSVGVSSLTNPTDAPAALAGTGRPASLTVRPGLNGGSWRCSSGQQGEGRRECAVSDGGAGGGPVCAAVGAARVFGVSAGSCRLP